MTAKTVEQVEAANGTFSEADLETLEFQREDLEGIESELEQNLDNISYEDVADELEDMFEGDLGEFAERVAERRRSRKTAMVQRRLLRLFVILHRRAIRRILSNPRTRAKLIAAYRRNPDAVFRLLFPVVSKVLPTYLRWLAPIYGRPVVYVLYRAIGNQLGIRAEEAETTEIGSQAYAGSRA